MSFDVLPNKWSPMPNMNTGKSFHSLVVVMNKLFVIFNICEAFDNVSKEFVVIKSPEFDLFSKNRDLSIENKIFILQENFSKIISYDPNEIA